MGVTIRQYQASVIIKNKLKWEKKSPKKRQQLQLHSKFKIPNNINDIIFVSFYTPTYPYDIMSKNLVKSLKLFNLKYDVVKIKINKSWKHITFYKPYFIKKMTQKYPHKSIVWLDTDSEVVNFPYEFFNRCEKCDIASVFRKSDFNGLHNCVIYFANNTNTKHILKHWIRIIKEKGDQLKGDQPALQEVLHKLNYITILELSHGYAKKSG